MQKNIYKQLYSTVGLGLRQPYYDYILENKPEISWFEGVTENYLISGPIMDKFAKIAELYPIVLHGVGMSLGSVFPLNMDYLQRLKDLIKNYNVRWVSDHLCWCMDDKNYLPDLYPMPYTEESINQLVTKINQTQDFLGQEILVENLSSYIEFTNSEMTEWEFVSEIAKRSGCFLLLDLNNVFVSAYNHKFDSKTYLDNLPKKSIKQYHLAGFSDRKTHYFDTHNAPVHESVWSLYEYAIKTIGAHPTLIEWDNNLPEFSVLVEEAKKAEKILMESQDAVETDTV